MQPLAENLKLIDREMIAAYFQMLFQHVEDGYAVMIRGIGEGGTAQEGLFRENVTFPLDYTKPYTKLISAIERWGQHHVASFVVPAAMDKSIFDDGKGTEDRVKLFTTVLVDLDKGDTDGALAWLTKYIGEPTMEVMSGGITETGQFKRHIYWALKEPTSEVAKVALVRGMIASKVGGDPSFKRIAQVVRIPGTVYAKGGVSRTCTIDKHRAHVEMELSDLVERANDMPLYGSGQYAPAPAFMLPAAGKVSFAAFAGQEPAQPVGKQLVEPIHAGGDGDATRWSTFNQVAGHYLHCARVGQMSLSAAYERTKGWVTTSMVPPWPDARIETEFRALTQKDVKASGAFPIVELPDTTIILPTSIAAVIPVPAEGRVFDVATRWNVGRLTSGSKPVRRFLVEGLIQAGKPHLIAAEGGAGKTGQLLDLGLKMAGYQKGIVPSGGDPLMWWGQHLTDECDGMAVVIVTSEDDEEEVHIRLKDMDEYGLLGAAAKRLHVVPLVDVGGAFPFVTKSRYGNAEPSKDWLRLLQDIEAIPNVGFVGVDTLNSTLHGEDTKPDVIQEYFNQLTPAICGKMRSALGVTHHIRKDGKVPIKGLADMKQAVRGSSALPAAVRAVLGFWHAHDFDKRLRDLGEPVEANRLYMAGVVKANNNEFYRGIKTLVRDRWGIFIDRTMEEKATKASSVVEKGWIVAVVRRASLDRHPFTLTGKKSLFGRRAVLPEPLQKMSRARFEALVEELEREGPIVSAEMQKPAGSVLDVPEGPSAKAGGYGDKGAWKRVDWTGYKVTAGGTVTWPEVSPEVAWAKMLAKQ